MFCLANIILAMRSKLSVCIMKLLIVSLLNVHIGCLFVYILYHNAQLVPEAQAVKTYSVNTEQWGSLSWGTNHL